VHGLEAEYGSQINFVYLNIDDRANDAFKKELGFRVQPHIFLVDKDGQVIQQWVGRVKAEDLEKAFQQVLIQ
jgi:thioredoxin-like negative regulator of GroEL